LVLAVIVQPPVPTEAASLPGIVRGIAHAGFLETPAGSSVASIGPLFPATLGCNVTPLTDTASAGSLRVGSFARGGSLVDKVVTGRTSSSASSEASSIIQNVNVLSGLITANEIKVVASSKATATNATSSNGSTFTNLVVAGRAFSATPGPNTRVNLQGLGYVILNKQTGQLSGTNATSITVRAIEVNVTTASRGLPAGTRLIIGHGHTGFDRTAAPHVLGGEAYGLFASGLVGPIAAQSGPWARAVVPCKGGTNTVDLAQATIRGVATVREIRDTASGQITASRSTVNSTSEIGAVNLLEGRIRADSLTATANARLQGTTGSATGSVSLVAASVGDIELAANPAPNTRVNLAGIGHVIVNQQIKQVSSTGVSMRVNALVVNVTTDNSLGLPVGTSIIVGHTRAVVTSF
jgi:hypothetical protein